MSCLPRRLTMLLGAVLMCLSAAAAPADEAAAKKPMAVWFYADWCPNCKLLAPKYQQARAGLEEQIRFVTLDVTDDKTKQQARATAKSLGIYPLYFSNQATGWVALLDAGGHQVGELHPQQSVEDMRAALQKLAGP